MPPEEPPLVERDGALAALVAALARPPAVVAVEGEPGAGKTRLLREALDDRALAGRARLCGQARPTLSSCSLAPVIEALATANRPPVRRPGALTGVLRAVLPDLAGVLPPAPPPLEDPHLVRHRLVRAVAELLAALGPTILVLEDVQWADDGTIELLRMIGARPPPDLAVAVTGTPPAVLTGPGPAAVRIRLAPLSVPGAGRLAAALLGGPRAALPRDLAETLYERNGGVPSAVCEDVRLLRRRGVLRPADGAWALAPDREAVLVPSAVGAEILGRVRRLGATGGAALEAAAVLAGSAETELVGRVAGMDAERTCDVLAEAARHGLLRDHGPDGGIVRFRHELARLAVLEAIPGYRRRRLHAIAARELTRTGRGALAVRAVDHHRRAGDVRAWVESAEAAAERAAADGSFEAAHACLRDVLQAGAVAEDRRTELAIKLGWAASGGVDPGGTTADLLAAALEGGTASPAQRAELLLLHAWSSRDPGAAADGLRAALRGLAGRPDLRAIALALLAMPNGLPQRDLRTQVAYLSRARAALARTTDPMAHAVVSTTTARLLLAIGSPVGGPAAEALPLRRARPEVDRQLIRGLLDLAETALHLGHYARGLELVDRGRRLAAEVRSRTYDRRLRAVALRARWTMGDLEADEQAGVLADVARVRDPLHARLLAAEVGTGQGRLDQARRTLREVAEEACAIGELAIAARAVAELNRVALTKEHRHAGHALARRVLDELGRGRLWLYAAPLLPFAPLDLVRPVLPRYRDALNGLDAPLARAALAFAEARMLERHGDASAGYRRARRAYAALPEPRLAAHACAGEVRAQLAAGRTPDADLLRQAWGTFTGLGVVWDAERLKPLMRAAGLPVPHRRGRPGYGDQLSPREREVVALAASGHTNRDIAANLFLSDRTVKFHLANAMRKLQVSSRRQLREALDTAGPGQRDHTCRCARCGRQLVNPQ
ncbi:LuxR family transcriptional regulator [Actinomadura vinacea]|uniref:LuxR family transcriptional regulator n=1 Tax=Actinomadura vinacea TaxID=115336 RepID=A0ABN3KAE4_9ACTN